MATRNGANMLNIVHIRLGVNRSDLARCRQRQGHVKIVPILLYIGAAPPFLHKLRKEVAK